MNPPPRFDFTVPLSRAVLDDPAFSPDPRAHPHFPLANARFYREAPLRSSSSSSSEESDLLTSPTVSSTTSPSHSPVSPPSPMPIVFSKPRLPQCSAPLPVSSNLDSVLKPLSHNTPRKARMKAFVRRLTARHSLDRIDELDETDPFGASYHHDGPYEAIGSNFAQPTLLGDALPRRAHGYHPTCECDTLPSRSRFVRASFACGEAGLSLNLEPGQILQPNTIYSSHLSSITAVPGQFPLQPATIPVTARLDPSRRQSLPNSRTRHHQDFSSRDGLQNRQSSSLRTPRERHLVDHALGTPNGPLLYHAHDAAPYVHRQSPKIIFPPPRNESRLRTFGPPPALQYSPPPPLDPTLPQARLAENKVSPSRDDFRHKTAHSSDGSHTTYSMPSRPPSSVQNKPLDPPRIRHLPKRLVMPTLLQPQLPQPHYRFPSAEPPAWQDEYSDDLTLEGAHFEGKPPMYGQEPNLLRKKSSFPAKTPIPDHAPISQGDALPTMENSAGKAVNDTEGSKERTRRRRLSKRKGDI